MKQVKVIIPGSLAAHLATWTFENGVRILLSYSTDDFFNLKIVVFLAVPDDKVEATRTEFKNHITE